MQFQSTPGQQGVSDWFDAILVKAIENRASDIHLEPERESWNVRFRIDGVLYLVEALKFFSQEQISSRIKVLSHMDIAEHRLPQDGHFEFQHQGTIYNMRVSVLPALYGETMVLRIFNREDMLIQLGRLGLTQDQLGTIDRLVRNPSGMLLITGPMSSGKTSLLYSMLHVLNTQERNIVTLEDPIEFQMAGIRQTQINEASGLTFAKAMRAVVRQDPDIVMLGEIRDADTAQISMQAALTGIFILSTFHTFDVPALVSRLIEMGVTNSVVAQTVKAVISSRLVRKICVSCKEPYAPNELEKRFLEGETIDTSSFQKGKGCPACQNRGYSGRIGVFEVAYFDEEIRSSILEKKSASFIHELLRKKQMKSLREIVLEKVSEGITTLDEVIRVVGFTS